jgi:cytochrome o ubiquinol oxidase subunit 2
MYNNHARSNPAGMPEARRQRAPGHVWPGPRPRPCLRLAGATLGALALMALAGCQSTLLQPKGAIGVAEKNLILIATGLMLLVVIPVIFLTLFFAWRYRASNTNATYAPKWSHSNRIEVVVWAIPIIIIAILGVLIWKTTHTLDPYQPIKSDKAPLRVEVVALNWKWLFIYPDLNVATVNELRIPVDTPVEFKLTAASIMNSFFIPSLGSQVYAMPGMQTKLHLIANHTGAFPGMSASFSGPGFADMHFSTVSGTQAEFDAWVARARLAPQRLNRTTYAALSQDSIKDPVQTFATVENGLFRNVVDQYMAASVPAATNASASGLAQSAALAEICSTTPGVSAAAYPLSMPKLSMNDSSSKPQE